MTLPISFSENTLIFSSVPISHCSGNLLCVGSLLWAMTTLIYWAPLSLRLPGIKEAYAKYEKHTE